MPSRCCRIELRLEHGVAVTQPLHLLLAALPRLRRLTLHEVALSVPGSLQLQLLDLTNVALRSLDDESESEESESESESESAAEGSDEEFGLVKKKPCQGRASAPAGTFAALLAACAPALRALKLQHSRSESEFADQAVRAALDACAFPLLHPQCVDVSTKFNLVL